VRALITTIPEHGHFRPLVPLAEALLDAGHEVAVATAESFGGVVSEAGFEPIAAGIDGPEARARVLLRHPGFWEIPKEERARRVIPDFFVEIYGRAMLDDAPRLLGWRPDVVIREEGEFAGTVLAALAGVPCIDHGWGPQRPSEQVAAAARALAPIRQAAGLEPSASGGAYEWMYLDPCPPSLQLAQADPIALRQPIRPAAPRASAQQRPDWLDGLGDRVVYITLGTISAFASDIEFLQSAITAAREENVEIVVTVGPQGDPAMLGEQPAVTNGGSGSTLGALSRGVPLLIVPGGVSPSQFRNGQAVAAAGAGRALRRSEATVARLQGELHMLLEEESYRCAAHRIAGEIAAMPSPTQAVNAIEGLLEPRISRSPS
jgi:UDP:flavonoid glycosyltransferase YjiC (YdhE family)